jgi:hypothetical protein
VQAVGCSNLRRKMLKNTSQRKTSTKERAEIVEPYQILSSCSIAVGNF